MLSNLFASSAGTGVVRISWTSDAEPSFRVYVDGRLVATVATTTHTLPLAAGAVVDVLESDDPPPALLPDRIELTWLAIARAERFRVERLVHGDWRTAATLVADERQDFWWKSPRLADGTEHSFRVTALGPSTGEDQVMSDALEFTFVMVRVPDPPPAVFTYNAAGGTVTVDLPGV